MHPPASGLRIAVCLLLALAAAQILVPQGSHTKAFSYLAVAVLAVILAAVGVWRNSPERRRGWLLVVAGFGGWVTADIVWTVEQMGFHLQGYPVPSDALYLTSYLLVALGIVSMVRTQRTQPQLGGAIDVTIIATGCLVFVASALILPIALEESMTVFGKVVSAAYPLSDVLLLVTATQLWTTPNVRSRSLILLLMSLLAGFIPDVLWSAVAVATGLTVPSSVNDAAWLLGYVLLAVAACDPSMRQLARNHPDPAVILTSKRRLALLAVGLLTPALALLVQETGSARLGIPLIGIGAVLLSVLTLLRMGSLLSVIETQSGQLTTLVNRDELTGAPNRRSWDRTLAAACTASLASGDPLSLALLDLDQFKRYNDRYGHQAGDRLLCEAVSAWTKVLADRGTLGRYGGEEFVVLFPGRNADAALNVLFELRDVTPGGQTFSAGVTLWEPSTDPTLALQLADRGLYTAKHAGRDRIIVYPSVEAAVLPTLPAPLILVQPVVDLLTGTVVAFEALSRFAHQPASATFRLARDGRYLDLLEGRAIVEALALPGRPDVPLHVHASADALRSERFWAMLPDDLSGVVVEISESFDDCELGLLLEAVTRLRSRGAGVATNDLGRGNHQLLRLAAIRPDVVKADRELVEGCAHDVGRQAALRGGLEFARTLGGELYAEGARDVDDLERLRALGIRYAQSCLLGKPSPAWAPPRVELPFASEPDEAPLAGAYAQI
jgi:diguanylate cyclase (GGDEF)-like protein